MLAPSIFKDNFVEDLFNDMFYPTAKAMGMNTDVKEFDDKYQLSLHLPGFKKEEIQAELKNGYLTITAEHREDSSKKDDDGHYIHRECYSGQCKRSFYIGDEMKENDIQASFTDGVLTLDVPKKEPAVEEKENRYIEIK